MHTNFHVNSSFCTPTKLLLQDIRFAANQNIHIFQKNDRKYTKEKKKKPMA